MPSSDFLGTVRVSAAIVLVGLCGVASVTQVVGALRAQPAATLGGGARFASALPHLPARGALGYVTTKRTVRFENAAGDAERERGAAEMAFSYLHAQQAVAPRWFLAPLAQMSDEQRERYGALEVVVGNFASASDVPTHPEVEVVHDAGNGVVVWRMKR